MTLSTSDSNAPYAKSDCVSSIGLLSPSRASCRPWTLKLGPHLVTFLAVTTCVTAQPAADARALFDRAVVDFQDGRLDESAAGFDRVAALEPDSAPQLWQRGIVLYYVGRYQDCREQFESHRTVNPNDVENAAWHFLCVARAETPERAQAALLPVGPDRRAPMREVYEMFQGTLDPNTVLAAAGSRASAQFYAHLYVGLYFEAIGRHDRAHEQITAAATGRYAAFGGYMHMVARVHLDLLRLREP